MNPGYIVLISPEVSLLAILWYAKEPGTETKISFKWTFHMAQAPNLIDEARSVQMAAEHERLRAASPTHCQENESGLE